MLWKCWRYGVQGINGVVLAAIEIRWIRSERCKKTFFLPFQLTIHFYFLNRTKRSQHKIRQVKFTLGINFSLPWLREWVLELPSRPLNGSCFNKQKRWKPFVKANKTFVISSAAFWNCIVWKNFKHEPFL